MTALVIVSAPPGLSVQDGGRIGYRRFGVSTSGAMDRRALALANALVGNPPDAAALEIAFGGAVFRAEGGPLLVAAVGSGVTLEVGGRNVAAMRSVRAEAGDRFALGPVRGGMFAYLAVACGILTPADLGSRAFHARSGIGGPALRPDTRLPCADRPEAAVRQLAGDWPVATGPIRYVPGPQADRFTDAAQAVFEEPRSLLSRPGRTGWDYVWPGRRWSTSPAMTSFRTVSCRARCRCRATVNPLF